MKFWKRKGEMKTESKPSGDHPIDAVIPWVDGSDPALTEKRNRFLGKSDPANKSSGAHATRFASVNEIRYCVLSIMRFAPFIRNIYIITDGQDPRLDRDIEKYFPQWKQRYRIVDHKEIFRGYEKALPSFNSISIGHMSWRIKGLSEHYVYFNDDTFLIRELRPEDWFVEGKPVLRGHWIPAPYPRLAWNGIRRLVHRKLLGHADYEPRASFHLGQWNSAAKAGFRLRYFSVAHTPHSATRSVLEDYWENHGPLMEQNIAYHFRDPSQFTFIALSHHLQLKGGNRHIRKPALAYLQPHGRAEDYLDRKLLLCDKDEGIKYLCVQSLDQCSEAEQNKVLKWLGNKLACE